MRGLYIHIPFCNSLCYFCDFPKRINQKEGCKRRYINKIKKEIEEITSKYAFNTVYIGGGTPNSLSLDFLEDLLISLVKIDYSAISEFTVECNYELITKEQALIFKKYNINRVSLGVQTLNKDNAFLVNKFCDYDILKEKIEILKSEGIENINLDFIFGLPNQTLDDVKKDLEYIKILNPKHVSYYSLILEDKTVINHKLDRNELSLPNDDVTSEMFSLIIKEMKDMGYHHYEISNFAKDGYESKHNLIYWNLDEYVGVGMSASSYVDGYRISNSKLLDNYFLNSDIIKDEIDINTSKGEYFWLGLRMIDGVSIKKYKEKYNSDPFEDFNIEELISKKLIEVENDYIKLTPFGLEHGNYVFSQFI